MNKIEYGQEYPKEVREHKSAVFCKVFSDKKDLLDLYNALNKTDYQNADDLEINTLENVVYVTMKNDVSFIIDYTLNLYEQQSTFNPNMPLRGILYFSQLYNKYVTTHNLNLFSTNLKRIPTPRYVVFYNGMKEEPDKTILKLSDAFFHSSYEGCLECEVTMLNVNYGHNRQLMEKCQKLREYAIFVDTARKYTLCNPANPRKAISKAVDECIENNILKDLLVSQKAEVLETMLTTFNRELYERELREEAVAKAREAIAAEIREEAIAEARETITAEIREEAIGIGERKQLLKLVQKKIEKGYTLQEIADLLEEEIEVIKEVINEL